MLTWLLLILLLSSLTACSSNPQPVWVEATLPALPACPTRPVLEWKACEHGVYLSVPHAIRLRDWLIMQSAWQESVSEIWSLYDGPGKN